MKTLRLFISSPGDVGREREATRRVIDRPQSEFAEHVTLDPYFWEWEPADFGGDYQSQIPSTTGLLAGKKCGFGFSRISNAARAAATLCALPELADPESPNPQDTLAAELRAHLQTVANASFDALLPAPNGRSSQISRCTKPPGESTSRRTFQRRTSNRPQNVAWISPTGCRSLAPHEPAQDLHLRHLG